MKGCCDETNLLFTCHQPVMKGFIVGIRRPKETVGIIDLEVVPAGVCGCTVTTNQESYTEGGKFGVVDSLHHWETWILHLTFILDAEGVFEGEGTSGLKHGCSFVGF